MDSDSDDVHFFFLRIMKVTPIVSKINTSDCADVVLYDCSHYVVN